MTARGVKFPPDSISPAFGHTQRAWKTPAISTGFSMVVATTHQLTLANKRGSVGFLYLSSHQRETPGPAPRSTPVPE